MLEEQTERHGVLAPGGEGHDGHADRRQGALTQAPEPGSRVDGLAQLDREEPGSDVFDEAISLIRAGGSQLTDRVRSIVVIEVRQASPLTSPAYDDGTITEAAMRALHRARFDALHGVDV